MGQDLRELFEKANRENGQQIGPGHEKRFLERLEAEFPKKHIRYSMFLKVAASVLILIGISLLYVTNSKKVPSTTIVEEQDVGKENVGYISLGDLSPDLKKIESYYVTSINLELSKLEILEENKGLVGSYITKLGELDTEYEKLSLELNEIGPNDQTITAMIKNLQLRLQLMHRLKEKLNSLKTSKNEKVTKNNV